MKERLIISWCADKRSATKLVRFFVRNVTSNYISHGEIQDGRASDASHWSPMLKKVLRREFLDAISSSNQLTGESIRRIATANIGRSLVGVAYVELHAKATSPFAVLEDLVVAHSFRGQGMATEMCKWIERQTRTLGAKYLFIENGLHNETGHLFFERRGYRSISRVMMKSLRKRPVS